MSNNARLWVCFAVKEEARFFARHKDDSGDLKIVISGIGAKNTRAVLEKEFANCVHPPEAVFTCGFAGGLAEDLRAGEIVYSTDEDFPYAKKLSRSAARAANFYHSDRIISSSAEKRQLRKETKKDAVEMESEAIRNICRQRGIPSATVRVISDAVNEDLPLDFNRFLRQDYSLNFSRLIGHLAMCPWKIPRLIGFEQRVRTAAKSLGEFLIDLIQGAVPERDTRNSST